MPSSQPKRSRPKRKPVEQRAPRAKSVPVATAGESVVRRKPLLDLCREAGWTPQHLGQPAGSNQELTQLLIKELVACREADQLDLTLALCDAAEAKGLKHPRIAANRERAKRAQERVSPEADTPPAKKRLRRSKASAPPARPKGFWRRFSFWLQRKAPSTPEPNRRTKAATPSLAVEEHAALPKREQLLTALKAVCQKAGWAPQSLKSVDGDDVGLACALEMQRCRQAGQHALVVALATEAAVLGLEHPRIHENLQRSRGKAAKANVLSQAQGLLQANPPAHQAAAMLLADALLADPDCRDYRKLLVDAVRLEIEERSGSALAPELRDATVDLQVNERMLNALERRRSSG